MERSAALWLLCLLLVAAHSCARARALQSYFRGGDALIPQPGPVPGDHRDPGDGGVEFNKSHSTSELGEVPQPRPFVSPLICSRAMARCLLHCYGHAEHSKDITYSWKMGDGEWEESENKIEILNIYELQHVRTFSCRMRNPVGEKDSEPIANPFYRENKTPESDWTGVGVIVGGAFGAAVLVSVALFAFYVRDFIRKSIEKLEGRVSVPRDSVTAQCV